jgi:glycosyltransferase involved in cell wall biosynthesis
VDISTVLPTYNRAMSLRTTLDSFSSLVFPDNLTWELLVVDNNSTDSTREVVEKFAGEVAFPVRYIFEKKQGRSAALNAGIAKAKGNIIAFTDDDVILDHYWLSNLKKTFDDFDCSAVAGKVVAQWNHGRPDWLEMEGQFAVVQFDLGDELKEIKVPPLGANSAFRREIFGQYGLFRLDLGVNGSKHTITCDDTEFGERLIQGGEKILYCPSAVIFHPVDPARTTKRYFLSWYYYNGVSLTRTAGLPKEGVFWFGVPRWLYRELLTNYVEWMFTPWGKGRFHHKLRTFRTIGSMVESYRLSREKRIEQVLQEPQEL